MKITAIKSLVCNARMRNWVFVKVETDQPGLFGWGEATLEWHTRSVVGAVEDLATLLMGEDPRRIEHLWQMMFRQHFWHSSGIVRATAMSGIDIALWDIVGKDLGVPCHRLWGGPVRDYVRLYCHLGGGRMEDFYETPVANADAVRRSRARGGREGIFTAFKSMAVPPTGALEGTKPVLAAEQAVARMRDAVGPSDRHHGRLPCPAVAGDGPAVRKGARALPAVFPRGAMLAGGIPSARAISTPRYRRRSRPASG